MTSDAVFSDLQRLAKTYFFEISESEIPAYDELADQLLETLDRLDAVAAELSTTTPVVPATRELTAEAKERADPLNAIVRWCNVQGYGEGSLTGMTVALKDCVAVAGIPLTCGSSVLEGFVPSIDSVVAERILGSGGKIVAMTNMDEFAFSAGGDSSYFGPTVNPFDAERTAGGSSGGSAAALHYECVDVAIGTDQGGSIRIPSAWCGVVGLKPTHGLVPYTGIVGIDRSVDHVGPMARSVKDVAVLLDAIAGFDRSDPRQRFLSEPDDYLRAVEEAPADLDGVRIGIVSEGWSSGVGCEPETGQAVTEAVERMQSAGARTLELSIPEHLLARPVGLTCSFEAMSASMRAGGNGYGWTGRYWPELAEALGRGLRRRATQLSPQMKIALILGEFLRDRHFGSAYATAQNLKPGLSKGYERALQEVDFLIMPTAPFPAHMNDPELSVQERVLRGWAVLANTSPTDLTGHPAISLPLAESNGLPVGIMVIGRHWDEARLLRFAASCERTLRWKP